MTISRLICGLLKVPAGANANAAKAPATAGAFATFHCSAVARDAGDAQWRRKRELPASKTSFGPLTNLPDYTFNDGRPTPLGSRQMKRVLQQREFAERIVQLCKEVDFAKERLPRLQRAQAEKRQQQIDQKLKPKGFRLL